MSILSEEIIEDLPITKEYLISKGLDPYKYKHEKFINKISSFLKYKIWNRFYVINFRDDIDRFDVSVEYDRLTNTLYIIYQPSFRTYFNYFPGKILQLSDHLVVGRRGIDDIKVIEKHHDINTQYFFDILFTNIFSDSKCEEIMQKFDEQWIQ